MKKTILFFGLVSVLSVALVASSSYAAGTKGRSGFMLFNSSDMIGAPVNDSHGEPVGIVEEVSVDSGGQAFVSVIYWGYDFYLYGERGLNSPMSFQELRISQIKAGQVTGVLETDIEHLDFVPYLNPPKKDSLQYQAKSYEYYDIQPYWNQSGSAGKSRFMELNSLDLVSATVEDSCGKAVGIVNEVMVDSDGHAFVVINHRDYDLYGESGVNFLVPFEEIRISQRKGGQDIVFLKTDKEHLDFAPYFNPIKKVTRQDEANIYEYYGIEPYWARSGESLK